MEGEKKAETDRERVSRTVSELWTGSGSVIIVPFYAHHKLLRAQRFGDFALCRSLDRKFIQFSFLKSLKIAVGHTDS